METNQVLVQSIINAMLAVIEEHHLELMTRYPNDVLIHDKNMLERYAVSGAKIAWMVGHSHSHMVILGLNHDENMCVTYLTNMCKDDRFYVLNIKNDTFKMKGIDRKQFEELSLTSIPYKQNGVNSDFWLTHGNKRVGHIAITAEGNWQERVYKAVISPVSLITALDYVALKVWCSHMLRINSQSIFAKQSIEWSKPIQLSQET